MRNVTHPEALSHEETQAPANAAAAVLPNPERNHSLGAQPVVTECQQPPENEVDHNGAAVLRDLGSDVANSERDCVLAILRAAYRVAHGEHQRIQADLDLLVGIARAVEADIYDPAFALERAVEHGLVAWTEIEVAP
jgi:hypothetical protein